MMTEVDRKQRIRPSLPTQLPETLDEIFPKRSQIAIVLGNGPSMAHFALEFRRVLEKQSPVVFGVNRIFQAEYGDYRPVDYYLAIDRALWKYEHRAMHLLYCYRYFAYHRYQQIAQVARLVLFKLASDPWHFAEKVGENMGHGYTSIYPVTQLAVQQGAKEIHFFGVDGKPNATGRTHLHGTVTRKDKVWKNLREGIENCFRQLEQRGIPYTVYSDLWGGK